jgi:hypothetical protein
VSTDIRNFGAKSPIGRAVNGKRIYAWEGTPGGGKIRAIFAADGRAEARFDLPLNLELGRIYPVPHPVDGRRFVLSAQKSQSDVWLIDNFDPRIK